MQIKSQQVAEGHAEHPHGYDGNQHGKRHIVGRSECIRQREGQRPDQRRADGMINQNLPRVLARQIRKAIYIKNQRQRQYDNSVTVLVGEREEGELPLDQTQEIESLLQIGRASCRERVCKQV